MLCNGDRRPLSLLVGDGFLPIAESKRCLPPTSGHTDISHGATFLDFPWSSFCISLLRMRVLGTLTAGDLYVLYWESWDLKWLSLLNWKPDQRVSLGWVS